MTGLKKGDGPAYDGVSMTGRAYYNINRKGEVLNESHSCVPISLAQALSKQALRPLYGLP